MNKYNFKSITEIENKSQKNKKYDFTPCEECLKEKESQFIENKIVILKKESNCNE